MDTCKYVHYEVEKPEASAAATSEKIVARPTDSSNATVLYYSQVSYTYNPLYTTPLKMSPD